VENVLTSVDRHSIDANATVLTKLCLKEEKKKYMRVDRRIFSPIEFELPAHFGSARMERVPSAQPLTLLPKQHPAGDLSDVQG